MQRLTLLPCQHDRVAPEGLVVTGASVADLGRKLRQRADHYGGLHLAAGADWMAVFSGLAGSPSLPWIGSAARYIRRLSDGLYCQAGLVPNVPAALYGQLGAHLAQAQGVKTPVALLSGTEGPCLFDLSAAQRIADVDFGALVP